MSRNPNKTHFLLYCYPRKEPINILTIFFLFLLLCNIVICRSGSDSRHTNDTHDGNDVLSFEKLHKMHLKSTPKQIMLYQIANGLHKLVNSLDFPNTFEHVTFLDQVVCTGRQLRFQILRNLKSKIGMNETANKLYYINNLISLDMLGFCFVHLKKISKDSVFKVWKDMMYLKI